MTERSVSETERYRDQRSCDLFATLPLCSLESDFISALLELFHKREAHHDPLDDALVILRRAYRSGDYRGSAIEDRSDEEKQQHQRCTFREFVRDIAIEMAVRAVLNSELTEAEVALYLDDLRGQRIVLLPAMTLDFHAAQRPESGPTIHRDSIRSVCEAHPFVTVRLDAYDTFRAARKMPEERSRALIQSPRLDEETPTGHIVDDAAAISASAGIGTWSAEVTDEVPV